VGVRNVKFATAIIILFITLIGIPVALLGFRCGSDNPPAAVKKAFSCTSALDCGGLVGDNVWSGNCEVPFWNSYIINYGHTKEEVKGVSMGIVFGTFLLDGAVYVLYRRFGREAVKKESMDEKDVKKEGEES
jgi:hypothetical protein